LAHILVLANIFVLTVYYRW